MAIKGVEAATSIIALIPDGLIAVIQVWLKDMPPAVRQLSGAAHGGFNPHLGGVAYQLAIQLRVRVIGSTITSAGDNRKHVLDFERQGHAVRGVYSGEVVIRPLPWVVHVIRGGLLIVRCIAVQQTGTALALVNQRRTENRLRGDVDPAFGQSGDTTVKIVQRPADNSAAGPRVFTVLQAHEVHGGAFPAVLFQKEIVTHL